MQWHAQRMPCVLLQKNILKIGCVAASDVQYLGSNSSRGNATLYATWRRGLRGPGTSLVISRKLHDNLAS